MTDSTPAHNTRTTEAPSAGAPAATGIVETKADSTAETASEGKPGTEESTAATAPEESPPGNGVADKDTEGSATATAAPIVSSNKRSRPPYKYDPNKITLRFLFANRDGLTVTVECKPMDTVGEVKGALLSVWPEDLPSCSGGDRLRLICMGKGLLMPDTRTLQDCQVPVFKTHPTPINVSVRPEAVETGSSKAGSDNKSGRSGGVTGSGSSPAARASTRGTAAADQGCACIIL